MPTEILMPALSPTMEEGKLAKWLVKEGQTVKAGDIIAEIETDKATMEVEAVDEGKVGKLLVSEGTEGVKVNTPIATLLADGESASAAPAAKVRVAASAAKCTTRSRSHCEDELPAGDPPAPNPSPHHAEGALSDTTGREPVAQAARSAPNSQDGHGHSRIFASPLGAAAGEAGGARSGGARRFRSAWARRQARRGDGGAERRRARASRGPEPRLQPSPVRAC